MLYWSAPLSALTVSGVIVPSGQLLVFSFLSLTRVILACPGPGPRGCLMSVSWRREYMNSSFTLILTTSPQVVFHPSITEMGLKIVKLVMEEPDEGTALNANMTIMFLFVFWRLIWLSYLLLRIHFPLSRSGFAEFGFLVSFLSFGCLGVMWLDQKVTELERTRSCLGVWGLTSSFDSDTLLPGPTCHRTELQGSSVLRLSPVQRTTGSTSSPSLLHHELGDTLSI